MQGGLTRLSGLAMGNNDVRSDAIGIEFVLYGERGGQELLLRVFAMRID